MAGLTAESVSLDGSFLAPRMLAFSVSLASVLALLRSFRHWESLAAAVLFRDERDVLLFTLASSVAAFTAVESSSDLATAAAGSLCTRITHKTHKSANCCILCSQFMHQFHRQTIHTTILLTLAAMFHLGVGTDLQYR